MTHINKKSKLGIFQVKNKKKVTTTRKNSATTETILQNINKVLHCTTKYKICTKKINDKRKTQTRVKLKDLVN